MVFPFSISINGLIELFADTIGPKVLPENKKLELVVGLSS